MSRPSSSPEMISMVRRALESFIDGKAELAQAVLEMDNVVDRMRDEAFIVLVKTMNQLVASIQETNPGTKLFNSPVKLTINGIDARAAELEGRSSVVDKGKPLGERIRLIALPGRNGIVLYMVFVAPEPDFDQLRPTFDRIAQSFRPR